MSSWIVSFRPVTSAVSATFLATNTRPMAPIVGIGTLTWVNSAISGACSCTFRSVYFPSKMTPKKPRDREMKSYSMPNRHDFQSSSDVTGSPIVYRWPLKTMRAREDRVALVLDGREAEAELEFARRTQHDFEVLKRSPCRSRGPPPRRSCRRGCRATRSKSGSSGSGARGRTRARHGSRRPSLPKTRRAARGRTARWRFRPSSPARWRLPPTQRACA